MPGPVQRISFARCHVGDLQPSKLEQGVSNHRSPAAEGLFRALRSKRRCAVLDFGPLNRENIELLTSHYCKMFIEDFHQGLPDATLTHLPDCGLDVVLCWDMFNYMERQQAEKLMSNISRRMNPGGILIMYIASGAQVPKEPLRFRFLDRQTVACEIGCSEFIDRTPLTSRAIHSMMNGWTPVHSLHLRNTFQEHFFCRG
jgi:hypothetical protein